MVEHLEPMLVTHSPPAPVALPTVMTMERGYWSGNNAQRILR